MPVVINEFEAVSTTAPSAALPPSAPERPRLDPREIERLVRLRAQRRLRVRAT
jgi:hypothetical protein